MNRIVFNKNKVDNFITKISKNQNSDIKIWLNSNFKEYLLQRHEQVKLILPDSLNKEEQSSDILYAIENKEPIVHIVLGKVIRNDINDVIAWLEKNKLTNSKMYSYEQVLEFSKTNHVVVKELNSQFSLVKVEDEFEIKQLSNKFDTSLSKYSNKELLGIKDIENNEIVSIFVTSCSQRHSWNGRGEIEFQIHDVFFNHFERVAFRELYRWLNKTYSYHYLPDNIFGHSKKCQISGEDLPLALLEDGNSVNWLDLVDAEIMFLPKDLTVKGSLDLTRSNVIYLGENLKVEGDVYAQTSQLVAIDDTVDIQGRIFTEDSLLTSFPEKLRGNIVNPKKFAFSIRHF